MIFTCVACGKTNEVTASVSKPRAICICEPCAGDDVAAYRALPHMRKPRRLMSNEQRYHLRVLAERLVTRERFGSW